MPSHMDKAKDKKMVEKAIEKHKKTSKIHQMGLKKGGMPKAMMGKPMMQKKAGRGR